MKWLAKRNKFGAKAVTVDGNRFDSTAEFKRWSDLMLLQRAKQISHLELHPRFKLDVNGEHICDYVADFAYFEGGQRVVEDVKSPITAELRVFRLKAKLMKALYNVDIRLTGKGIP